jgi:serine/threonine protein kinase
LRSKTLFLDGRCKVIGEQFSVAEALGQGSTGVVYKARRRCDDCAVALKVMRMDDEEMLDIARKEFEILRNISHPNIIQVMDFFAYPRGAILVLEFFEGRNLKLAVRSTPSRCFSESTARGPFEALLRAVSHLHQLEVIHRDIKAENVLVSNDLGQLRLVDFNAATRAVDGCLTLTGTADYLAPEVLLGESPTESADVWASGICLHFMLAGKVPMERTLFRSHSDFGRAMKAQVTSSQVAANVDRITPACEFVLRQCLELDPKKRHRAEDILNMEWFRESLSVVA